MRAKFEIQDLLPIGLTLIVLGIGLTYGLSILEETQTDFATSDCAGYYNTGSGVCQVNSTNTTELSAPSTSTNATGDAITGVAKLPEKLPLIVTVIVAAVIIGILVRYLMVRFS